MQTLGQLPDPKNYDGIVMAVKYKDEERYGYLYIHHAFYNLYRDNPLSFIGLVIEEGQNENAYENVSEAALDVVVASTYELIPIRGGQWLKHNLAYRAACKLQAVKNKSHYHESVS